MSKLRIKTEIQDDGKVSVNAVFPETPRNIFLYENVGGETLGQYIGVANASELTRYQAWTGKVTPVFGNRYVRHNEVITSISAANESEITAYIDHLIMSVKLLDSELARSSVFLEEVDTDAFTSKELLSASIGSVTVPSSAYSTVSPTRISLIKVTVDIPMVMDVSPGIDGQELLVRIIQGTGSNRSFSFGNSVQFSVTLPPPLGLSTTSGLIDEIKLRYNLNKGRWIVVDKIIGI